jgi:AraC-like DNA-binding protein
VTYAEPADCGEQQRVLACPVRYGCEHERLYFPVSALDLPLVIGDSGSRTALEIEARRRLDATRISLSDQDPILSELKRFVSDRLRDGPPSVEDAATATGISVRTLQRRLETHGSSYRDVVDVVRREMAERYVREATLSQVDIAFLLGFSDQSSFHRAFRRWFATTPGDYRAREAPLK